MDMTQPFFSADLESFCTSPVDKVIGSLTEVLATTGYYQQLHTQTRAWRDEVEMLQQTASDLLLRYESHTIRLILEYPLFRRGKRIDAIFVAGNLVAVLEFKVGSRIFNKVDMLQVEDYAMDLHDFHSTSLNKKIIPVLVCTDAHRPPELFDPSHEIIEPVRFVNKDTLSATIVDLIKSFVGEEPWSDPSLWEKGEYQPTPTIIEAAQDLYAGHDVREISRSHAGIENLSKTTEAALKAVDFSQRNNSKVICFITGVPGAGKTLAGLNIVHSKALHSDKLGVFLSGNGPLVKVLREALSRDRSTRNPISRNDARGEASTFIQNIHHYLNDYHGNGKIPPDRIVIFDEAQRAWNAEQSKRKFQRDFSEAEMILSILDRHEAGVALIALIGGGQEINRGEAGLMEWGRVLIKSFPHWRVYISPELKCGHHSTGGFSLFETVPTRPEIVEDQHLHLSVSIRSYRAESLSLFIAELLNLSPTVRISFKEISGSYPIFLTRDLKMARNWIRQRQKGMRRTGVIASSGARRLKAFGIDVTKDLDVCNWFLNPKSDVRSSDYLEDIATEFGIQGLELDWVCVCWDADLRYSNGTWEFKKFVGTKWQNVNSEITKQYILNKYRVLLTRAREGMILWVPTGDSSDPTRSSEYYDGTAEYLRSCGIPEIG